MQKANFSEPQPDYRYFLIEKNRADVIIHDFIGEETDEEGSTSFVYHINCFSVDPDELTEEMVKADPMRYMDFSPSKEEADRLTALEQQNTMLMECLLEMSAVVYG